MFKRLRNEKGYFPFPIVFNGIGGIMAGSTIGVAGVLVVASVILTPSHRLHKAVKKCVNLNEATAEVCLQKAEAMTSIERREYIRDTLISPSSDWDY